MTTSGLLALGLNDRNWSTAAAAAWEASLVTANPRLDWLRGRSPNIAA